MHQEIIGKIKKGGIGVIPTDTIYGIVGSALARKVVERIYFVKGRNLQKPFIILISSIEGLSFFDIEINEEIKKILEDVWPGKVSVVLPCLNKKFQYLHRGTQKLAFRVPDKISLREILQKTGPLVAPSANPEGEAPARTIKKAKEYFGNKVDFYIDGGTLISKPSTLIEIKNKEMTVLREGVSTDNKERL